MSDLSDSDAIGRGSSVRPVRCVYNTGRTDTLGHPPVKLSDLLRETFGGEGFSAYVKSPARSWGTPPEGVNADLSYAWPSHTAADMGPGPADNPVAFALPKQKPVPTLNRSKRGRR